MSTYKAFTEEIAVTADTYKEAIGKLRQSLMELGIPKTYNFSVQRNNESWFAKGQIFVMNSEKAEVFYKYNYDYGKS